MDQTDEENKLVCPHGMKELNPSAELCVSCCGDRGTIYCIMDPEGKGPRLINYGVADDAKTDSFDS